MNLVNVYSRVLGFDLEARLPQILKLLGFGDKERDLLSGAIIEVLAKVSEIDLRSRRFDAVLRAIAAKHGIDADAIMKDVR